MACFTKQKQNCNLSDRNIVLFLIAACVKRGDRMRKNSKDSCCCFCVLHSGNFLSLFLFYKVCLECLCCWETKNILRGGLTVVEMRVGRDTLETPFLCKKKKEKQLKLSRTKQEVFPLDVKSWKCFSNDRGCLSSSLYFSNTLQRSAIIMQKHKKEVPFSLPHCFRLKSKADDSCITSK